jgi:hypothetical protein
MCCQPFVGAPRHADRSDDHASHHLFGVERVTMLVDTYADRQPTSTARPSGRSGSTKHRVEASFESFAGLGLKASGTDLPSRSHAPRPSCPDRPRRPPPATRFHPNLIAGPARQGEDRSARSASSHPRSSIDGGRNRREGPTRHRAGDLQPPCSEYWSVR